MFGFSQYTNHAYGTVASYTITTTMADIGLSAIITTTGKRVFVSVLANNDGGAPSNSSYYTIPGSAGGIGQLDVQLHRDSTIVGVLLIQQYTNLNQIFQNPVFNFSDLPSAGTYTYKLRMSRSNGSAALQNLGMLVWET